jgi:hypothetical protein
LGPELLRLFSGFGGIAGLSCNLDAGITFEHAAQALPE